MISHKKSTRLIVGIALAAVIFAVWLMWSLIRVGSNEKGFYQLCVAEDTVNLQTDNKHIIGSVLQLVTWDTLLCLPTRHEVFLFDQTGKYAGTIGREGNGPGEFSMIAWVATDRNQFLDIYDDGLKRMSIFDKSGKLVGTHLLASNTNSYLMFVSDSEMNYYFYNRNLFADPFAIDVFDSGFVLGRSICKFPYNSVVQMYLAGNIGECFQPQLNRIVVINLLDQQLKTVTPKSLAVRAIPIKFDSWVSVDQSKVHSIFPTPSTNPHKLFTYFGQKTKLWRVFPLPDSLVLLEYYLPGKGGFTLQVENVTDVSPLFTARIPKELGEVIATDGDNLWFAKEYYGGSFRNPTLLKFRLKVKS